MEKLIVGPLLGLESDSSYTFCFLTPSTVQHAEVIVGGSVVQADMKASTPDGLFWRASTTIAVPQHSEGLHVRYTLRLNGEPATDVNGRPEWQFYIPGADEEPIIAYASCNGVSQSDLFAKMENPFGLWERMADNHLSEPISLLLMGGDQVYADSIWDKVKELEKWSYLTKGEQVKKHATKVLKEQLDRFYSRLYVERWNEKYTSLMLASVPSVMMWDDHDIFDGWGSFPDDMQTCPVFREVFASARKYFELYQVRTGENASLLSRPVGTHYSMSFKFRNYAILGLDNRSDRSTEQVMSSENWDDCLGALKDINEGNLVVMTAVPVVYRDFSFTETAFDVTPWDEELADDLKDHWRAKEHQGERNRLIMNLLKNAGNRARNGGQCNTLLLSGDVHVGCLGVITDRRTSQTIKIHQIVSSGIVHPSPSLVAWLGIQAVTNDDIEVLNEDRTIEASMLKPIGSKKYIRARNFVTLHRGSDDKIWVNWIAESCDKPVYVIS